MAQEKKVYAYTRVSTEMQVEGFSLDGQYEEIETFCKQRGYTIVKHYSDKGKSGKTIVNRPEFKRMLEDIELEKDHIDYVVVFKLSRFGRSLIDTINSLQVLTEHDVALITVDNCIDTSNAMGKLMLTILASVAEMEVENINEQTFLGRQQKAREGKWNGGFAPYGYRISNGKSCEPGILVVEEEEAKIVRRIYDLYTINNLGVAGIVTEFLEHGITKIPRSNSTSTTMGRKFISDVLSNPVYCGKIAYGRRHTGKPDKKTGKRSTVFTKDYILAQGRHTAIISEEQFHEAERIRNERAPKVVKRSDNDNAHLLSTLIVCPCCGGKLYGNTTRKKRPGGGEYKDYHFYACKHRLKVNGQSCTFRRNINTKNIDDPVIAIITKLVDDPHLAEVLSKKLESTVDKESIEQAIDSHRATIDRLNASIARLGKQIDHLDFADAMAERKEADLLQRQDALYTEVGEHEQQLANLYQRLSAINQSLLTRDYIWKMLQHFGKLFQIMSPIDRQTLIRTIVSEIEIFPDKQPDGRIVKRIKLAIPIVYDDYEKPQIGWDNGTTVESIVTMIKGDDNV